MLLGISEMVHARAFKPLSGALEMKESYFSIPENAVG